MRRFAALLDRLSYEPQRTAKLKLLSDYFSGTPDPDRGWAVAALTGDLDFRYAKLAVIRDLITARMDPVLFSLSYDYVGDLAETVSLVWPEGVRTPPPKLQSVVERLLTARRTELPTLLATWLDSMSATERWALLKLVTGALRVGVSARLARTALATMSGRPVTDIEEVWHAVSAPYADLFAWLDGKAKAPPQAGRAAFRPVMLAHPIDELPLLELEPGDFQAEWKWDGIRVQMVGEGGILRLYARSGDEITAAFPDALAGLEGFTGILDGELLVGVADAIAPFADLQKRLNRKTVAAALMRKWPAFIRAYDLLLDGPEDIRGLPLDRRRQRLERQVLRFPRSRIDLSPLVPFSSWKELAALRLANRHDAVEGLMLKRRDSIYLAGRPTGLWWKWKRDPMLVDTVLMYAQRGHGSGHPITLTSRSACGGDRRSCQSAKPISASRTRSSWNWIAEYGTTQLTGLVRYGRSGRNWFWKWHLRGCRDPAGTSPASPCASRESTEFAGTSQPRRPTGSKFWKAYSA